MKRKLRKADRTFEIGGNGIVARTTPANAIGIVGALTLLMTLVAGVTAVFALDESPAASGSSVWSPSTPVPSAPALPPATKLVPSDEGAAPSSTEAGAAAGGATSTTTRKHRIRHRAAVAAAPPEVEPATARLRVVKDGWIYAAPSKSSRHLEKAISGKFVNVTGATKYYLQVKLKDGPTGYIPPTDVELVKPIDKIFVLTQDAPVLDAPNRWARKIAEVHRTHSAHIIGIALNYLQIRMKSGLVGFIPVTAAQ